MTGLMSHVRRVRVSDHQPGGGGAGADPQAPGDHVMYPPGV